MLCEAVQCSLWRPVFWAAVPESALGPWLPVCAGLLPRAREDSGSRTRHQGKRVPAELTMLAASASEPLVPQNTLFVVSSQDRERIRESQK